MALKNIFKSPELPKRVMESVEEQQQSSERLIGWIQLGVVTLFGVLYAVAPKTISSDAAWQPVPWVLAAYALFTVTRLYVAYHRPLPGWFVALSVVADMALLMGVIWSFHVQYDQPPSFYLKAPTMLYVFIFIALRALRFQATFVMLAGIVAALGWGALVLYVLVFDPADPVVTRDYVEYLTANRLLIGAELDKIISILVVTAILALAIYRAKTLLERQSHESAVVRALSRFFSAEVVEKIQTGESDVNLGEGIARHAAAMMVDLRGFTELTQNLSPDEQIELVVDYQSRIVPIIVNHHGTIDRFEGDGIVASFGAVAESKTFARDALEAAVEIVSAIEDWSLERVKHGMKPVHAGVAVTSGRIIFGIIGDQDRLEYTILGDCVNRAAKIEKHTKIEGVRALASKDTYDLAREQGFKAPEKSKTLNNRRVDGLDKAVDLIALAD